MTFQKQKLREKMLAELSGLSPEQKAKAGQLAQRLLSEHFVYRSARTIMMYMAIGYEVSLQACIEMAGRDGKIVALPRVDGSRLVPQLIENVDRDIKSSAWGVPEPRKACKILGVEELNLILVPGLAFDHAGRRLGRGKGFYDRFLASLPSAAHSVGICHKIQLVDAVPYGPNDTCVKEVLAI